MPKTDKRPQAKRLSMRIEWVDYQRLLELRVLMRADSDSHALRSLIGMCWKDRKTQLAKARKDAGYRERLQELTDEARQLTLLEE